MPVPTTPANLAHDQPLLPDYAYDQILARISDGRLPPGAKINDQTLADELGISKAPVRQALTRLAEVKLIEMAPNRYTRVARPDATLFIGGLQIVAALWSLAAEETVPELDEVQLATFDGRIGRVRDLLDGLGSGEGGGGVIQALHEVFDFFVEQSGNPLLLPTIMRIQVQIDHFARASAHAFDPALIAEVLDELSDGVHAADAEASSAVIARLNARAVTLLERLAADAS